MNQTKETAKSKKMHQILHTAQGLFQKYGMKRISIEEICKKSDASKMTFYKYFSNKNELIKFMLDHWMEEAEIKTNELKMMDVPFTEKIRMILEMKEESSSKLSREFIHEYFHTDPDLKEYMEEFFKKGTDLLIDFIEDAQKKGEVRKELRPEFLVAVMNKLWELPKDEELINLYPSHIDFILEINNFLYCGVLPMDKEKIKNESNP